MLQSFAGGTIVAERYGTEPPVVLALHGWGRSRVDFAPLLAGLGLPALALDLPGFGLSPPPPDAWGVEDYARAVVDTVLGQCAPDVAVIGHSFGGRVAVHVAARAPGAVAGIVVTGAPLYRPPGAPRRPPVSYRVVRSLARAHLVPASVLEAARQRHGSEDYRRAEGVVREILVRVLSEEDGDAIAAVTCPVELVWGADDTAAPVVTAERARDAFSHGHLVVLEGVDHFVPTRAPEALAEALGRLRGAAP